jgi:hypothetical protein
METAMRANSLVVRCMVVPEGDQWVALCLDFDLAAQAATVAEAKERLDAQISDYVTQAVTVDRQDAPYLLRRKAPLRYRALFRWLELREHIAHHVANGRAAYERAMPLVPAHA